MRVHISLDKTWMTSDIGAGFPARRPDVWPTRVCHDPAALSPSCRQPMPRTVVGDSPTILIHSFSIIPAYLRLRNVAEQKSSTMMIMESTHGVDTPP